MTAISPSYLPEFAHYQAKLNYPMLLKMIWKLLLKACIPLCLVAGVASYAFSALGGSPAAVWKGFGSGVTNQIAVLYQNMEQGASDAVDKVSDMVVDLNNSSLETGTNTQSARVFTWKDEYGVTQYSNVAPEGREARVLSINPNQNIMEATKAPKIREKAEKGDTDSGKVTIVGSRDSDRTSRRERQQDAPTYGDAATQEVADQLGGTLPGVAGQLLSNPSSGATGKLDPSQLLRMFNPE